MLNYQNVIKHSVYIPVDNEFHVVESEHDLKSTRWLYGQVIYMPNIIMIYLAELENSKC